MKASSIDGSHLIVEKCYLPHAKFYRYFRFNLQSSAQRTVPSKAMCFRSVRTTGILFLTQSQKTQGFCAADFATLSDERRSRSKIFPLYIWIKEPCVRKFEGLERSKRLGISQTKLKSYVTKFLLFQGLFKASHRSIWLHAKISLTRLST